MRVEGWLGGWCSSRSVDKGAYSEGDFFLQHRMGSGDVGECGESTRVCVDKYWVAIDF